MTRREKHDALFNAIRIEAMNAPLQLSKHLMQMAEDYRFFQGDLEGLIDAAVMLAELADAHG